MCGRYHVKSSPKVRKLLDRLGIHENPEERTNIAPGARGQFVVERNGTRQLLDGYWSLLIEPKPDGKPGYRPNPAYHTFNARSDRLNSSPLWKKKYRTQRAIVPADGFHEWVGKQCYDIAQEGQAIAFGGLYETWHFENEEVASFAIITLPPHPKVRHIHAKSLPLMLEPTDYDCWLDPHLKNADAFHYLMRPVLHRALQITPVKSPTTMEKAGEIEIIEPD